MTQQLNQAELEIRKYSDYSYDKDINGVLRSDASDPITIAAYWSDLRIDRDDVPNGYRAYGIRITEGDYDTDDEDALDANDAEDDVSIARFVTVNHYADVIIPEEDADRLDAMLADESELRVTDYFFTGNTLSVPNSILDKRYAIANESDDVLVADAQ